MRLFAAELENELVWIKRYPLNYLSNIALYLIMFFGIFLGGSTLTGANIIGRSFTSAILGFSLWTLITSTLDNMGFSISQEAETGTLEQLYLMPVNPVKTFLVKGFVNLIYSAVYSLVILFFLMLFTGKWLHAGIIVVVPFLLALISVTGLGYLIAGLTLRYKRIGATLQIAQFIYLGLLLTDFRSFSGGLSYVGNILPVEPMVYWIQDSVNDAAVNVPLNLLICSLNAVIWLILGMLFFNHVNNKVKKDGTVAFF
ncbi:ABC transporter permease [Lactobacillus sp. ESL0791]|uniref:ABC transporter permease n=1 Tax=Lactobacillus sp. ESL0791 TaxID=2983234 RepID=UPI0023F9C69D|nr:ABC transporter permease [Lactobacillus sp. ESL0791]MDF7639864.1 ABC transporter permease [Lactobacillus sp. ESL0791]